MLVCGLLQKLALSTEMPRWDDDCINPKEGKTHTKGEKTGPSTCQPDVFPIPLFQAACATQPYTLIVR